MYVSVRDDIVFAAGYTTLAEGLAGLQIDGIELFVHEDDTVTAILPAAARERLSLSVAADRAELARQAADAGATICAFCMGNNFNAPDRQFQVDWAVRTVRAAQEMAIPAVRIDAAMRGERDLTVAQCVDLTANALVPILEATADSGVDLGIENHGFMGNDPAFLRALFARVGNRRLGLTLDSGNFYWRGWPLSTVYGIFDECASLVKHTHVKNIAYPPELREVEREVGYEYGRYVSPILEGDIDHHRYIETLKRAGYDRDLCLEDESFGRYTPEERQRHLRDAAVQFREWIG